MHDGGTRITFHSPLDFHATGATPENFFGVILSPCFFREPGPNQCHLMQCAPLGHLLRFHLFSLKSQFRFYSRLPGCTAAVYRPTATGRLDDHQAGGTINRPLCWQVGQNCQWLLHRPAARHSAEQSSILADHPVELP